VSSLAELSGREPDDIAVESAGADAARLTWAELDRRSLQVARGLERLGAVPGAHVALCVSNRVEFVEALLGAWRAGCAYTPLKTGWTADEVGAVLDDAKTVVVVTDRDGARAAAAARQVCLVDLDAEYGPWRDGQDDAPLSGDRCGFKLPYTSGTTGRPKGVVMAGAGSVGFDAGWAGLARWAQALRLPGDGVHLFVSRLFNGAPQTFGFGALARGATLRILTRWDPVDALRELERPQVTSTIMVPTMFRQLLALPEHDRHPAPAPGLRTLLHGGEPCPAAVKQAIADWFGDVLVEYYGFTEGGLTVVDFAQWRRRPGTVGRPLPGMQVRILDDAGRELPAGSTGTVYFAAEQGRRFRYLGDDAKTGQAHRGNAFTVGDLGRLDADGYLYLDGRSADVVITGGVNVYPAEIEMVLAAVPGIDDLCAVAMPDPMLGEVVALFVVLADSADQAPVLADLAAAIRTSLAPYKRPRAIALVSALPRDEAGKLLRRVLRDRLREQPLPGAADYGLSEPVDLRQQPRPAVVGQGDNRPVDPRLGQFG
jgi:long-chain acyl-CoA synthetase